MSGALILKRLNNSGRLWSMRIGDTSDAAAESSGIFLLLNHSSPRLMVTLVLSCRLSFQCCSSPGASPVDSS